MDTAVSREVLSYYLIRYNEADSCLKSHNLNNLGNAKNLRFIGSTT